MGHGLTHLTVVLVNCILIACLVSCLFVNQILVILNSLCDTVGLHINIEIQAFKLSSFCDHKVEEVLQVEKEAV